MMHVSTIRGRNVLTVTDDILESDVLYEDGVLRWAPYVVWQEYNGETIDLQQGVHLAL